MNLNKLNMDFWQGYLLKFRDIKGKFQRGVILCCVDLPRSTTINKLYLMRYIMLTL